MSVVAGVRTVDERIANELFRRLQKLAAGYTTTTAVSEVIRPTVRGSFSPQHLQIVLTNGTLERAEESDCPGNPPATAWRRTFNIRCHVSTSELDETAIDEMNSVFYGDVVKVVCDESLWHTFGGLAFDANWTTPETVSVEGSFGGINIPIQVSFRHDEGNPYNARA